MKTEITVELTTADAQNIYGFLSDVPWTVAGEDFKQECRSLLLKIRPLIRPTQYQKLWKDMGTHE